MIFMSSIINKNMFDGKKILITGGTGSLGQALTKRLLKTKVETIRIFSRNENKQVVMSNEIQDDRLRFFIGDIRDYSRLIHALEGVDVVFHAAALKHVPVVEYNSYEAVKTNVIGSQNVIEASIQNNVDIAVGIGTDKAVSPLNAYGATKLLMEKLFVTANNYLSKKTHHTKFLALRYGNVFGSSGSVIPKFIEQIKSKQKITVTDPCMTRFSIMMDDALDFIIESTLKGTSSEIFIPKLKSYSITDLKDVLFDLLGDYGVKTISIRPGEKLHETLINSDEMRSTWETKTKFAIINPSLTNKEIKSKTKGMKKVKTLDAYSSDLAKKLSKKELKQMIRKSGFI